MQVPDAIDSETLANSVLGKYQRELYDKLKTAPPRSLLEDNQPLNRPQFRPYPNPSNPFA